jgi:hypothetical protein
LFSVSHKYFVTALPFTVYLYVVVPNGKQVQDIQVRTCLCAMLGLLRVLLVLWLAIVDANPLLKYFNDIKSRADSSANTKAKGPLVMTKNGFVRGGKLLGKEDIIQASTKKDKGVTGKVAIVVPVVIATIFGGVKLFNFLKERYGGSTVGGDSSIAPADKRQPSSSSVSSTKKESSSKSTRLQDLLSITKQITGNTVMDAPISEFDAKYTVLLFDCDEKLTALADINARLEYFHLMTNLTSNGNVFNAVYIPSSGNGNPHMIERNETFRPNWIYLPGSLDGKRNSGAIRDKFDVKPEELRIMLLGPDMSVISDNALDLLRINPYGMPWEPTSINDIIGSNFVLPTNAASDLTSIDLSGKITALYFSASWCKPCQVP